MIYSQPILDLKDETVRTLFRDEATGSVLVGTSHGRILIIKRLASSAYLTGDRTIYATRINGFGEESEVGFANIRYGLLDKIVEVASDLSITRWKDVSNPIGIDSSATVSGVFTTPVLWAGEDFGWWGDVSWSQSISDDHRIVLAVKIASSESSLASSPWKTVEKTSSGSQTWSLDELSTAGAYAQLRVVLESGVTTASPSVFNLVIPFLARHASYFFLTKISMEKGTSIRGGLLTASFSAPRNTDVKWGVTGGNSTNWNQFTSIEPDKLFELPDNFGDRMKVGVKMLSYDNDHYPSVDEFAVAFDSDIDNLINRQ